MTQNTLNNLANEKSPYLLEHATNPVNWYAWSDVAFKLAKEQNKMIFVSVGYSSCHWCHIMRRESFENTDVAQILNEYFISIKVDREERPDIDHLLQITFQIMNGRGGGWPLSIFMTPDKKPFYSGTYFPIKSRYGMPGFIDVLQAVIKAYTTKLNDITAQSLKIENYIKRINEPKEGNSTLSLTSDEIIGSFAEIFDPTYGGFGTAPKFPSETPLYLLLQESAITNNTTGLKMVYKTIEAMFNGGIYDQLGGGFHRYSVDESWLVPHFEKMLYNQSLLCIVLLDAFRVSKNTLYLEKVKETLKYVNREMKNSNGGFYSSQNADSEGIEGKYFVWDKKELEILDKEHLEIFCDYYGVTKKGNWEGKNILHITSSVKELMNKYGKTEDEINKIIIECKKVLFQKRDERIKPEIDRKIITSWNALMIKAFIMAYRTFANVDDKMLFFNVSKEGVNHILHMIEGDCIYRICIDDNKSIRGFLDDFQYSISALLDFYEITLDDGYLSKASALFKFSVDNFYDTDHGGFFFSLVEHETILTRFKDFFDSPLPSPNAFAIQNAIRLSLFEEMKANFYLDIAEKSLQQIKLTPGVDTMSLASMIYVKQLFSNHYTELTISYSLENNQLHNFINQLFIPYRLQIDYDNSQNHPELNEKSFLKGKNLVNGEILIFLCKNYVCSKPLDNKESLLQYLGTLFPNMNL